MGTFFHLTSSTWKSGLCLLRENSAVEWCDYYSLAALERCIYPTSLTHFSVKMKVRCSSLSLCESPEASSSSASFIASTSSAHSCGLQFCPAAREWDLGGTCVEDVWWFSQCKNSSLGTTTQTHAKLWIFQMGILIKERELCHYFQSYIIIYC